MKKKMDCFKGISTLLVILHVVGGKVLSSRSTIVQNGRNTTYATLGVMYNGTLQAGDDDTYYFQVTQLVRDDEAIRLRMSSQDATEEAPVLFVARLTRGVLSWTVPFVSLEGNHYQHVSHTLCSALNMDKSNRSRQNFYIDVSTSNPAPLNYSLIAYEVPDFQLSHEQEAAVTVNPAEPVYFQYTFSDGQERVLVTATSKSRTCALLIIQNTRCPSFEQGSRSFSGLFASVTTQASIVVSRSNIPGGKFYVILVVEDTDRPCEVRKGEINPFSPTLLNLKPQVHAADVPMSDISTPNERSKTVSIVVKSLPSYSEYVRPVMIPVIFFGVFYLIALLAIIISWCQGANRGRSLISYLFPQKVKESETEVDECDRILQTPCGSRRESYGSHANAGEDGTPSHGTDEDSEDNMDLDEYDRLDDLDKHKDVYRLKRKLFVADMSKKSYKKLSKKFNVYFWNTLTVAVFYALPVIQLVLTYQKVVNASGDQDICFYNFECSRPYHVLSAFNNVYSNIGYVLLGILFLLLTLRRDRLSRQSYLVNPEREQRYGIPKHNGILYAMGYALAMEGVLSACYHVCPNYSNFQFDTAFMYMIGLLGCLRLYQTRHHDVFLSGQFAFTGFAAIIFTSVIGVIFRSWQFWVVFMILHCGCVLYLTPHIYYMGRIHKARDWFSVAFWSSTRSHLCPTYIERFVLLLLFNLVNWAMAISGVINIPRDFATYLLGIIIVNGLLYVGFYVVMKLRHGESIRLIPFACIVLSLVGWGISISFFIQGLTDWQLTPAESREGNRPCKLLNFYDDHDLWHFLSAIAMFFSFMSVMTLDDDLDEKDRSVIPVF